MHFTSVLVYLELYNTSPLLAMKRHTRLDDEVSDLEEERDKEDLIYESTGRGTFGTVRSNLVGGQPKFQLFC